MASESRRPREMHGVPARCVTRVMLALLILAPCVEAAAQDTDYLIGPQDVLEISIFNQPDLDGEYTVEADGMINFPLIGRVVSSGLTLRALEEELEARLADGFFRRPEVSVGIERYESQRIFIVGEVRQPGAYTLTSGMTLVEALASARLTDHQLEW